MPHEQTAKYKPWEIHELTPAPLLQAVNPAIHSLSFLFLLRFQIHHIQKRTNRDIPDDLLPGYNLWKHAVRFLRLFDPIQIRYAGHEWRRLVELIASAAQSVSNVRHPLQRRP